MRTLKPFLSFLLLLVVSCSAMAAPDSSDKLRPEEVVAKHLAAIGSAEALQSAKSRIAVGNAKALSRSNAIPDIKGVAQFASDGDRVLLAMIFDLINYPYEKAGYDGQKMTVALIERTGERSTLGEFLTAQHAVFKEGLIGGVLSSAWPLLETAQKRAKLSYAGTEKIDGREAHKLKYNPRSGSGDFQVNLFFDAETFRHVRTEYQYVIPSRMGSRPREFVFDRPTDTGSQTLSRYKLVEDFSDFKTESGLTLPHTYKLRLTVDAQRPRQLEWVINFTQFIFNQPIEAGAFNVSSSK